MAQGREWTPEERETIIQSLKPYLELGYSRNKACSFIGLTPSTLSNWVQADESLGIKLTGWENTVNSLVMANIVDAIRRESELEDDIRKENSWKWAERRMKEDFSTKTETDITSQGQQLGVVILPPKNNDSTVETTTETGDSTS